MALSHGEGAREYYAEGRAAAEITRLWAAIERSVQGDPWLGTDERYHAQAGGVTTPLFLTAMNARPFPRVFFWGNGQSGYATISM